MSSTLPLAGFVSWCTVVASSNPRSCFVNSQLVFLLPVKIIDLFPLFQWHACQLAKLSACKATCKGMTAILIRFTFYIYIIP